MENEIKFVPSMDDLVFENRNKEYGAYVIRKKYNRTMLWAILVGIIVLSIAVITPYILATVNHNRKIRVEKVVQATMDKLDQPIDVPPPPPPPPPAQAQAQVKFVAPVVVDSIKVKGPTFATGDEAKNLIKDQDVNKPVAPPVEIEQPKEEQVFYVVEEAPTFQGGDISGFRNFIQKSLVYPEAAQENGIQGKVYISFIVEPTGKVSNVKVLRGVDPSLDKEAVRAIENSPKWSPGKQRGKAVRVSFTIPIVFQLQ